MRTLARMWKQPSRIIAKRSIRQHGTDPRLQCYHRGGTSWGDG
jgi:hypothetical protein